jgi:predicted transcriptional regulator of viral defense system
MSHDRHWTAEFYRSHPVFRTEQFLAAARGNDETARTLLKQARRGGRIRQVRRGLWYAAPDPAAARHDPDPFAVAATVCSDSVICMHAAMQLHGYGYSMLSTLTYYTASRPGTFTVGGAVIRPVALPAKLVAVDATGHAVDTVERHGTVVRVTSIERSLVDMLDRQDLSGGIEEVWRTADQLGYLDDRRLLDYVRVRGSAQLAARTGYLVEHVASLRVADETIEALRTIAASGAGPFVLAPGERGDARYDASWQLRVPLTVAEQSWEEPVEW